MTHKIDPSMVIDRQGRKSVLYAGLLDLAHTMGALSIRTQLIQPPTESNFQTAIAYAEATLVRGPEDVVVFTGLGDASPANVARQMTTVIIRLAETRAKARALRDMVNVGMVSFEEMGEDGEHEEAGATTGYAAPAVLPTPIRDHAWPATAAGGPPNPPTPNAAGLPSLGRQLNAAAQLASAAQIRYMYSLGEERHHLSVEAVNTWSQNRYGDVPSKLSKTSASNFITEIQTAKTPPFGAPPASGHRPQSQPAESDGDALF